MERMSKGAKEGWVKEGEVEWSGVVRSETGFWKGNAFPFQKFITFFYSQSMSSFTISLFLG